MHDEIYSMIIAHFAHFSSFPVKKEKITTTLFHFKVLLDNLVANKERVILVARRNNKTPYLALKSQSSLVVNSQHI